MSHIICFVLGGPGSGKGTICQEMVKDMGFRHISLGELIRDYIRDNPTCGRAIKYEKILAAGDCISSEEATKFLLDVTEDLFHDKSKPNKVLIDGYPRTLEQLEHFNDMSPIPFCPKNTYPNMFMLYLDAPSDVMKQRILGRGRDANDLDEKTIDNRLDFYYKHTKPVIDHVQENIGHQVITLDGKLSPTHNKMFLHGYFHCLLIQQTIYYKFGYFGIIKETDKEDNKSGIKLENTEVNDETVDKTVDGELDSEDIDKTASNQS